MPHIRASKNIVEAVATSNVMAATNAQAKIPKNRISIPATSNRAKAVEGLSTNFFHTSFLSISELLLIFIISTLFQVALII